MSALEGGAAALVLEGLIRRAARRPRSVSGAFTLPSELFSADLIGIRNHSTAGRVTSQDHSALGQFRCSGDAVSSDELLTR